MVDYFTRHSPSNDTELISVLCIKKPFDFIMNVTKALKEQHDLDVFGIKMGACMYQSERIFESLMTLPDNVDMMNYMGFGEGTFNADILFQRANEHFGTHPLFTKTLISSCEHEYRFIWDVEQNEMPDYIDIEIPDAISLCDRLDKKDL